MAKKLWILTEERPKSDVIHTIIEMVIKKLGITAFFDGQIKIVPICDSDGKFTFRYSILGVNSPRISEIELRIVSGQSSFVDYLIYAQDELPCADHTPLLVIEETKTTDAESRNTGIFQRATKFVYVDYFYPGVEKVMLYNLATPDVAQPTMTNIFGTRCLLTLGVRIVGKEHENENERLEPFGSIDELIKLKSAMGRPPAGNTPIDIKRDGEIIEISGRLVKSGRLAHDPNIGALSLISATLRQLGWKGKICLVQHGLVQSNIGLRNKFLQICNLLELELDGLSLPVVDRPKEYWYFEQRGEKLVTIFLHLLLEGFTNGRAIYENHAGCERGYFVSSDNRRIAVSKRVTSDDGTMPKSAPVIPLPDLVVLDPDRMTILNIEGEMVANIAKGVAQLDGFTLFEVNYVKKHYANCEVSRHVVVMGGSSNLTTEQHVCTQLADSGDVFLSATVPAIIEEARNEWVYFWQAPEN